MFYPIAFGFFVLLQSTLILSANINILPEVFFLSYLVNKGYLPFRDYFDDHGFLLQLMLSPFTLEKNLILLKIIYLLLHSINLILFLLVVKEFLDRKVFILAGLVYLVTILFLNENDFWFETFLLTFYLCLFYLTAVKRNYSQMLLGLLIALVSFVKVTAGVILLPILLLTRKIRIAIIFSIGWFIVIVYYFFNRGLPALIYNLFSYNFFISRYYRPSYLSEQKLLLFGAGMVLLSLCFAALNRKSIKILPAVSFWLASFIFLASGYSRLRLIPLAVFSLIIVFLSLSLIKPVFKKILLGLLLFYLVFMSVKLKNHWQYLRSKRTPYIENKISLEVTKELKKINADNFYILSNNVQPYFLLDKLPPVYYPLKYPLIEDFNTHYEDEIISGLKNHKIKTIIVPNPIPAEYKNCRKIMRYIKENYRQGVVNYEFTFYNVR